MSDLQVQRLKQEFGSNKPSLRHTPEIFKYLSEYGGLFPTLMWLGAMIAFIGYSTNTASLTNVSLAQTPILINKQHTRTHTHTALRRRGSYYQRVYDVDVHVHATSPNAGHSRGRAHAPAVLVPRSSRWHCPCHPHGRSRRGRHCRDRKGRCHPCRHPSHFCFASNGTFFFINR